MPRSGHRKSQKLEIEALIAEILIDSPEDTYIDVDFKLRSDLLWRSRLPENTKLPQRGTIKNYVSNVRSLLRRTGSDRPWSILASSNPNDIDYVSPTDLPLILDIWRARLAMGNGLTLRQARWIVRLRHLISTDTTNQFNPEYLFSMAVRYAGREAALTQHSTTNVESGVIESHDLDGVLAFDYSKVTIAGAELMARSVSHQAAINAGLISSPQIEDTAGTESIWDAGDRSLFELILDLGGNRNQMEHMNRYQASTLFSVVYMLSVDSEWTVREVERKSAQIMAIVDAVAQDDWSAVAVLADIEIKGLNPRVEGW